MSAVRRLIGIAAASALATGLGYASASTASAGPSEPWGNVTTDSLTVRYAPSTHAKSVGQVGRTDHPRVYCKVRGTKVADNDIWYGLNEGKTTEWVSAKYVTTDGVEVPWCNQGKTTARATTTVKQRVAPTTEDKAAGVAQKGRRLTVVCQVQSQSIKGNKTWLQTSDKKWVSAKYLTVEGRTPKACSNLY